MKTIVAISDLQSPYEDRKAVEAVAQFIEDTQPEVVVSVGDEADFPQISRWTQGTAGEYTNDFGKHRDRTVDVLRMLGVQHVIRSNHTDRVISAIRNRVPGFLGLPELTLESILKFEELGITYHKEPWELAPGWLLMHGDEGGLSKNPGTTAKQLTDRTGMSVICGHTHRMGLVPTTMMVNGTPRNIRWGFEVGHLINTKSPGMAYTKGSANWQQGFGLLHVDGKTVIPQPVPIVNKSFVVNGKVYSWR